jgi:hypothetical protein
LHDRRQFGLSTQFTPGIAEGGGIAIKSVGTAGVRLVNCVIAENEIVANHGYAYGGGIYVTASVVELVNCTILYKTTTAATNEYGGGFYQSAVSLTGTSKIQNTIFWLNDSINGPEIYRAGGPTLTISHSDITPSEVAGTVTWQSGNIDVDPEIVVPEASFGFEISYLSPCINKGDASVLPLDIFDLDSDNSTTDVLPFEINDDARQVNPAPCVDMGAHEVQVAATCEGDITGSNDLPDSEVNVQDLMFVIAQWGTPGGIADMAGGTCGDGTVNTSDLLVVLNNWGTCNESGQPPQSVEDCYDDCYAAYPTNPEKFAECMEACIQYLCEQELIECD